jgi:hypothetical protein
MSKFQKIQLLNTILISLALCVTLAAGILA